MTKAERKRARQLERMAHEHEGRGSSTTKWIILAISAIAFLAFFGAIIFLVKQNQSKPVALTSAGHAKGEGKVTLVEFGDLQCPACKAYEPMVRNIQKDFKGQVKLIFKHFPLTSIHPNAMLAAQVSVAADNQGKFWEMHDWLYDNHESWATLSGADAREKMLAEAKKLKLDMTKFEKDIDSAETHKKISETQNEGINLGVAGTPSFYLDDKKIEPLPANYDEFKKIVADAVKAKK